MGMQPKKKVRPIRKRKVTRAEDEWFAGIGDSGLGSINAYLPRCGGKPILER